MSVYDQDAEDAAAYDRGFMREHRRVTADPAACERQEPHECADDAEYCEGCKGLPGRSAPLQRRRPAGRPAVLLTVTPKGQL